MRKHFARDLDFVLDFLYKYHYKEYESPGDIPIDRKPFLPTELIIDHFRKSKRSKLSRVTENGETKYKYLSPSHKHAKFILWHLQEDGMIEIKYTIDLRTDFAELTNKGRMFREAGGYRRQLFSTRLTRVWKVAATIAAFVNGVAIFWLTYRSFNSSDLEKFQREQLIQIETRNLQLEETNSRLESQVQELLQKTSVPDTVYFPMNQ